MSATRLATGGAVSEWVYVVGYTGTESVRCVTNMKSGTVILDTLGATARIPTDGMYMVTAELVEHVSTVIGMSGGVRLRS